MKSTSLLIITMVVCAASSVYAETLTITKKDLGGSRVAIGYSASSADCIPAAFALQCTLTGGTVSLSSVLSYSAAFDLFPDYRFSNPNSLPGQGTPLAQVNTPGGLTNSVGAFSICMSTLLPHEAEFGSGTDLNYDGFVDLMDASILTQDWLSMGSYNDLNGDTHIDIRDFAILSDGVSFASLQDDSLVVLQLPAGLNASNLNLAADTFRGGAAAFSDGINCTVVFVPEPATLLLLGLGGVMLRQKVKVKRGN